MKISGAKILAAWVVVFLLGTVSGAVADPQEGVIKIGVITSLTGPAGAYGLSTQCSFNSLARMINEKGGIAVKGKKYTVQFVFADDKLTVAGARAAAEKLLYSDRVDFFAGSLSAHMIRAWAPLVNKEKKIALIGSPAFSPQPEWPYLFHVSSTEASRGYGLCKLMKEKFGVKSVLYVFADSADGKAVKEIAIAQEKIRALEVKDYILTHPTAKDFYPLLMPALKRNPDFICVNLVPGMVALFIKQARELGYKGMIGSSVVMAADLDKWQRIAGIEASKGYVGVGGDAGERSPIGLENARYFEKNCPTYKSTDIAYVLQPHILLLAIEKSQSFDSDVLRKTLMTETFHSLLKVPIKAGGEKTYGAKLHMDVPVPYSRIVGLDQVECLGTVHYLTP